MQELADVSIQYTNCADPVEREARRQRVLQSNAEGIMEETAASIIAADTRVANASTQPPLIPASDPILLPGPGMTIPKCRGRPPKEKKQSPRPKNLNWR
ncbi:hypothetical protein DY000_02058699 [Brassica cretica]|uniref:Uncharacterized protein n=1 Tax=Brassica cretica TaxID=69181 RepID=A0ABQ7APX2_BRACR|nr:hypothetical protein DY000_02058699 [Brassica cretica]